MLKTPIAEGTLTAVGTGATADTLGRRGIILYYILCISLNNRDSLKCFIYRYYNKRRDDSNIRITSNSRIISKNSRNLSNSWNSNNSRDARKTAGMPITAGTGEMLKTPITEGTLTAVGTGATADTFCSPQRDYTILYSVH